MKIMFIVYHDLQTEARSQEILSCVKTLGQTTVVSYSMPVDKNDCKIIITGQGKRRYFAFISTSIKSIIEEKPEIIVLHDNYTAIILAWLYNFRKNIYVIYDSSELYIGKIRYKSFKKKIASIMNKYEERYLKYANIVIAANIERAMIMKEYFKLKEQPLIFDNIHRIDEKYDIASCDKKYGCYLKDGVFCIVSGGGIGAHRLTFELVETVGKLGNKYCLIIVGETSIKEKNQFDLFIAKNNINNVFYLGFIPRNEWKYILNNANISVSTFAQDTLNNINCASGKTYESLFEGIPILTSENPPLKRLCSEYRVGVSNNNFYEGIIELEKHYNYYCENVRLYNKFINFESRINNLSNQLRCKIENQLGNIK